MAAPRSLWMALVLLGTLGVAPPPAGASFQEDQFLGRWFAVGLASNASWFLEKKAILSMCQVKVAPLAWPADGKLNLTIDFLRGDEYETWSLVLLPAGTPSQYYYTTFYSGNRQYLWVETDSDYALLYTVGVAGETSFHLAMLYSRTETPQDAVKDKFTTFAAAKGFAKEEILFRPKTGKCMESHQ